MRQAADSADIHSVPGHVHLGIGPGKVGAAALVEGAGIGCLGMTLFVAHSRISLASRSCLSAVMRVQDWST